MIVYDIIHGYQPFTNNLTPGWVGQNLDKVYLPTSKAMADGLVRHNIQLQGWTIESWLNAPTIIKKKAEEVLKNLQDAVKENNVEVGFSAYSHALLPLLGDELAYAEMSVDYDTVKKHLAEPRFFWYPECGIDAHKLRILYRRFPGTIAVIPDKAVGMQGSRFATVTGGGVEGEAAVCNVLVKDVLMNSVVYEKPDYVPDELNWERSLKSMRSGSEYKYVIETLDNQTPHVVVRDWENGESRNALKETDGTADVAAMLEAEDVEYRLLSEHEESSLHVSINEVSPSCWEPASTRDNPYPYWTPTDAAGWRQKIVDHWLEILRIYENAFNTILETETGCLGFNAVDDALKNKRFHRLFKETSPTLLSCLPWHLLAREEWERFPEFPRQLLEKIVKPEATRLLEHAGHEKEKENLEAVVKDLIKTIELNVKLNEDGVRHT
jgi:hypothetical protein